MFLSQFGRTKHPLHESPINGKIMHTDVMHSYIHTYIHSSIFAQLTGGPVDHLSIIHTRRRPHLYRSQHSTLEPADLTQNGFYAHEYPGVPSVCDVIYFVEFSFCRYVFLSDPRSRRKMLTNSET